MCWEKTTKGIWIGVIESPATPEAVADVHEEAVEIVDVFFRIGFCGRRCRWLRVISGRLGDCRFESAFVEGEDATSAGEG